MTVKIYTVKFYIYDVRHKYAKPPLLSSTATPQPARA